MTQLFEIIHNRKNHFVFFLLWFVKGTFKTQSTKWTIVALTISLGVSLAVAINIVNKSAITEFNHSTNILRGDASFQIKGKTGFFNELIFEEFLNLKKEFGVLEISPVLELTLKTKDNQTLNVLGVDFLRVASATPVFLAIPEESKKQLTSPNTDYESSRLSIFGEKSIFLSPIAQKKLNVSVGDSIPFFYAGKQIFFTVAGSLSNEVGDNLVVMDIASFQSAFNIYGKISRLDFKVLDVKNFEQSKLLINKYINKKELNHKLEIVDLTSSQKKNNSLSKAYYVNLSILALVALFTGMFLVYSVLSLSVQQQNSQFALLRTVGLTKKELITIVVFMGLVLSLLGSTLGIFFGIVISKLLLFTLNANLGANLIFQDASKLHINWFTLVGYWMLGLSTGVFASVIPAIKISAVSPKYIFTTAERKKYTFINFSPFTFFLLLGLAFSLLFLPAYKEVPLASYISIALILFAFIGIIPKITLVFLRFFKIFFLNFSLKKSWFWLGLNRLINTSGESGPIISSIVVSFALTIAILIMVTSFRDSVISWLDKLLVADLYGNVKEISGYSNIDKKTQEKLQNIKGIRKFELSKSFPISLDASKANIKMIIRQLHSNPESKLFLIGERLSTDRVNKHISEANEKIIIYSSESMKQLYGHKLGEVFTLPFPHEKFSEVVVAGFYRDYSNQHGSVVVKSSDYTDITGKSDLNNLAIWLEKNFEVQQIVESIKSLGGAMEEMEFRSSTKIREISLKIFDQTFYVAYLLGFIALFISIFSIFCTYISQAKVRKKEFSLLFCLGVSGENIVKQVNFESFLLCFLGVFWGMSAGVFISFILIYVVNPQSFNWTLNFTFPITYIFLLGFFLIAAGVNFSKMAINNELKKFDQI